MSSRKKVKNPWKKVVFAADLEYCPVCGEPYCRKCNDHYADCKCLGPTQDGVEYKKVKGVVFGRLVNKKEKSNDRERHAVAV